ncbi:MAG: thioesterase family protein [Burkholderiales bacterium]
MALFDQETSITRIDEGVWETQLSANWNIGANSNGGYALSPVLRALSELTGQPDPISVTTHYLRPVQGGSTGRIETTLIRSGRTLATARGTLSVDGKERLVVIAALGDIGAKVGVGPEIGPAPPELPPVEACTPRADLEQGIGLPLLSRVDCAVHPDCVGQGKRALVEGWIRFSDGADPTTLSLPLFADAFPPSLTALVGNTGWVPTIELTVHVRRVPEPGWLRVQLECDDLHNGRMIETGSLWDSGGAVVARVRQIGLLLDR